MIRSKTIIIHIFFGKLIVGGGRREREILQVDVLNESELWMIFITESPLKIYFPHWQSLRDRPHPYLLSTLACPFYIRIQ